jgi:anti-sigma factor ChrR (cupin superfamily)
MPAHGHHGYEECLVLQGDFYIGDLHLKTGDFHCATQGAEHGESRTDTGVVVFLKSSVHDYPEIQSAANF